MGLPDFVWDPNLGWSMGGWKEPVRSWEDNMAVLRKKNIGQPGYDAQGYRLPPSELYGGIPVKDGGYDFSTQTGPVSSNKYEATPQDDKYQQARDAAFSKVPKIPYYMSDGMTPNPEAERAYDLAGMQQPGRAVVQGTAPKFNPNELLADTVLPSSMRNLWDKSYNPNNPKDPRWQDMVNNPSYSRLVKGYEDSSKELMNLPIEERAKVINDWGWQNELNPVTGNPWKIDSALPGTNPLSGKKWIKRLPSGDGQLYPQSNFAFRSDTPQWTGGKTPIPEIDNLLGYLFGIRNPFR